MGISWKRYYFASRNRTLALDQFPERWRQHANLGAMFPDSLRRHPVLNYGLVNQKHSRHDEGFRFDGIGMLWLGSPEELERVNDDPNCTPTMRRDELLVFQKPVYDSAMIVEELICRDGPLTRFAILHFVKRRLGVPSVALHESCHAIARTSPFQRGNIRRCISGTLVRVPTIDFDGAIEFWFDAMDEASMTAGDDVFRSTLSSQLAHVAETQSSATYLVEIIHTRRAQPATR